MKVQLYRKPTCSLCDEAKKVLERVRPKLGFELEEIDIQSSPELAERYGKRIPVVVADGAELSELEVDAKALEAALVAQAGKGKAPEKPKGTPRPIRSAFSGLVLLAFVAVLASKAYQIFVEPERLSLEYIAVEPLDIPAPPLSLESRDGKRVTLADFKGQTVFLNFWATWCDSCRMEMPSMARLAGQLKRPGFAMLAVSVDDGWKEVDEFLGGRALDFTVLRDPGSKGADAYGTHKLPETYIIGPDGRIKAKFTGPREWDDSAFDRYFANLLGPAAAPAAPFQAPAASK